MPALHHQITIATDPAPLWAALSTQQGLSSWWTPHVQAEPREGATWVLGFGGGRTRIRLRIEQLVPERELLATCIGDDLPDWSGTELLWELSPQAGGGTSLRLTHSGWPEINEAFRTCNTDWGWLMHVLKDQLEGRGRGAGMG